MDSPSPNKISKVFSDAGFGEGDKGGEVKENLKPDKIDHSQYRLLC
jgi:hypothetical protein